MARRKHWYSGQYKNVSHNISYKKGHWFLRKAFIRAKFMERRKTSWRTHRMLLFDCLQLLKNFWHDGYWKWLIKKTKIYRYGEVFYYILPLFYAPFVLRLFALKSILSVYTTFLFVFWFSFKRYLAGWVLLQFLISDKNMFLFTLFNLRPLFQERK